LGQKNVVVARKRRIKAAHGRRSVALGFALSVHPHDVVADFVVTAIIAAERIVRLDSNTINQRCIVAIGPRTIHTFGHWPQLKQPLGRWF
jgi:hypothetical protein